MSPRNRRLTGGLAVAAAALTLGLGPAMADDVQGTAHDDDLQGTPGPDRLYGYAGNDDLEGHAGPDVLRGGPGFDSVYGGRGHDVIRAGGADDSIFPGPGPDVVIGGLGGEEIWLYRDHAAAEIRCGAGIDFVILDKAADPGDSFVACEAVFINTPNDDW
jgi:Ca2+-binding RTX toxin-like protein